MNKNKLIIFDLDGTLYKLDGGSFLNSKLNKKILKNVVKYIQKKLKKNKKEAEIILKKIKKKYGENISIGLENDFKINRYDYFNFVWDIQPSQYIKKYPNLKKILAKLNKNYEFVLMSDAPCIWINNVLNELDINIFFKNKIFSGEGNKRKIFNNRFDELIKKYNFKPEQIATIGDQEESDIIPAKKLGIKTVYINNKKSKIADVSIKNLENLESIFNYLFNKNQYFKFAFKILKIKNFEKIIVSNGSSGVIVFRYKNNFYKAGSIKKMQGEINSLNNFKKILGKKFNDIFPKFTIVKKSKKSMLCKFKIMGECNLEYYLLNSKFKNNKEIEQINLAILKNIDIIFNATYLIDKNKSQNFFKEIILALECNLKKANLLNKDNTIFLKKLKKQIKLFTYNYYISFSHKDLTAGNIIINKKRNLVFFIDSMESLPNYDKSLSIGNIAIDLVSYLVTLRRKNMEYKKKFKDYSFENIIKQVNQKIIFYQSNKIINQEFIDLCNLFCYSVYLACKCNYCMNKERKWLYIKMEEDFNFYKNKIQKYF